MSQFECTHTIDHGSFSTDLHIGVSSTEFQPILSCQARLFVHDEKYLNNACKHTTLPNDLDDARTCSLMTSTCSRGDTTAIQKGILKVIPTCCSKQAWTTRGLSREHMVNASDVTWVIVFDQCRLNRPERSFADQGQLVQVRRDMAQFCKTHEPKNYW